ncbi:ribonuclease E/G [Roseomonas sp. KE0001]|uniref:ribonuclease E/G n=1 Tax=Roseomonas sp. KE0001 TaxID=2479201 RepID=UPI0018E055D5|nr:ribonuclease E/G [Roseomonas sp. KE0001]MBI0434273.1 ribonuclease E/G [Roseomonas sp. KE0001]
MTKRMLIDASHSDETRVVVLDGNRLDEFDIETENKRPLKGNIYLAKVVRVEPSLQAAFVEYGGNRHGFLAFGEIHPDYYQLPVADRERLLALQAAEAAEDEEDEDDEPLGENEAEAMAAAIERFADDAGAPRRDDAPAEGNGTSGEAEGGDDEAGRPGTPRAQPMTTAEHRSAEPEALLAEADEEGGEDEPEAAPETLGGRDQGESRNGDSDEGRAERRIPPRFLRHYKIQEVIRRRQIMLVQVVKEERGNKGAALTTYISLAGRFSVLMPNSPRGGGISRKITSVADRKRLREVIQELGMPRGMSLIVRTAGAGRPKPEIRRDCEYLLRLWDDIRERTLDSVAPALIYEEADLIKRSIRDVFGRDIEEIQIEGEDAYRQAREFMRMLMPHNDRKIRLYKDPTVPLFARHGVDAQLDAMMSPTVRLKSGGYLVINQTEALVSIDVNSGRATRDRHIEDTALRTNLEAADEVARQLRLRDLAGLIVIDFIDMESSRNDAQVERRLKEALRHDRARIQVGRISHFGLLEMSRQRLRPSVTEHSFVTCPHCQGLGIVRTPESSALQVLRQIEEEGGRRRAAEIAVHIAPDLAMHILNRRRDRLAEIEARYGMSVFFQPDASLLPPAIRIETLRAQTVVEPPSAPAALRMDYAPEEEAEMPAVTAPEATPAARAEVSGEAPAAGETAGPPPEDRNGEGQNGEGRRRRRRRRRRGGRREDGQPLQGADENGEGGEEEDESEEVGAEAEQAAEPQPATPAEPDETERRLRRRGRRSNRPRGGAEGEAQVQARYAGPTPADPFAGTLDDIFDAMAAAEEAAERGPAPAMEAVTAEVAPVVPVPPEPVSPPAAAPDVPAVAAEVTPAAVAPIGVEPVPAAADAAGEKAGEEAPVAAKPRRAPRSRKKADVTPAETPAAPLAEPTEAAAPPKPRRSSRKKAEVAPAGVAEAAEQAEAPAPKPRRSRRKAEAPAETPVAEVPVAEPAVAEVAAAPLQPAEPAPVEDPSVTEAGAAEPQAAPPVQPVLVDASPDAPKKRGWWKR